MLDFNHIKRKKVLVIGDVMLDQYYVGDLVRISPEAPVPILNKVTEYIMLGGAANVAANLSKAEQMVSIASVIGRDQEAERLISLMEENNLDVHLILKDDSRKTTVKTRVVGNNNQQIFRIDTENKEFLDKTIESVFLNLLLPQISEYSMIILSDYMKGVLTDKVTTTIINVAKKQRIKVLIDVKDRNFRKYKGAFLLKPNLEELNILTGRKVNSNKEVASASKYLRRICESDYVLATQGRDGMTLVDRNDNAYHIQNSSIEVFDVTGAGDAVITYLAVGLLNDLSIIDSMYLASYAAGAKILKVGTAGISINEVKRYIGRLEKDYKVSKIIELSELLEILYSNKEKKIVFTNGCFDILHNGHLVYLKEASKLGDIFIVGVNSDNSIRRIKGSLRPIMSEVDRMSMLAALEFVDYVIRFDEDTPLNLIKAIQPDVLVKGGDYSVQEVVGREFVEKKGGKVIILPLEEGESTTNIINRILNKYAESDQLK